MPSPLGRIGSSLAAKRARSQDSRRSSTASPAPKAAKTEELPEPPGVPAFLRQTRAEISAKFHELEWQQQLRIAQGRADPSSRWAQDITHQVRFRNRYLNVQPWDKSRIHLRVAEGKSDYINASPISLRDPNSGTEMTYIATQGPKESGSNHFWQMVWHETSEPAVIVMLTRTAEAGREKCSQYFPMNEEAGHFEIENTDENGTSSDGKVQLTETAFDEASRTTVRKFVMTVGEDSKTVWHLLFSGWPDFDIPEDENRAALLELCKLSTTKNGSVRSPRIIHCSAGVGRSGTFIALEYLLTQVETGAVAAADDNEDIIYDVVNHLREQRMTMVQSEAQYSFLYDVILEQYKRWETNRGSGNSTPSQRLQDLAKGVRSAFGERSAENEHEKGKEPPQDPVSLPSQSDSGIQKGRESRNALTISHCGRVEDSEH